MRRKLYTGLAAALLAFAAPPAPTTRATDAAARPALDASAPEPEPQPGNIAVNGFFSVEPAQQGSTFQAAVVMEIPRGLHVNSNKPLGKYAVPTVVKVDAPKGLRVTPVSYPRGTVRTFRFGGASEDRLAVYEGRTIFRFNVSVPADAEQGVARLRVSVRFQSCNDEVCFPPATREMVLPIAVVSRGAPSNRINSVYFPGGRRKG
ncbi:MAG TPA: protein-disulfide reductase DsbD domain-containing protein [Pyrinomonadaceae bacterium]|jgi:DsbC/DsbD-like thiol-disulfide interchange protein